MLYQLLLVLSVNYMGVILGDILQLPVPGTIIGMVILFILLQFKILKLEKIKDVANFLLLNMTLFFLPPAVKLIENISFLNNIFLKVVFLIIITTIFTMIITAKTVQFLIERGDKNGKHTK